MKRFVQVSIVVLFLHFFSVSHVHAQVLPTGVAGNWQVIFTDDFSGSALDTSKWRTDGNWGMGIGCQDNPKNVSVYDGYLHLFAKDGQSSWCSRSNYSSSVVQTGGYGETKPFAFTYGFIEARVNIPKGKGLWPGLWLYGTKGGAEEIDLAEWLDQDTTTVYLSIHYADGVDSTVGSKGVDWSSGWHTIGLDWEPGLLVWYIDGIEKRRITDNRVPANPMYILNDIAVGGWAGNPDVTTPFPADYKTDYIYVWKKSTVPLTPTLTPQPAPTLDKNGDGKINVIDLGYLIKQPSPLPITDILNWFNSYQN